MENVLTHLQLQQVIARILLHPFSVLTMFQMAIAPILGLMMVARNHVDSALLQQQLLLLQPVLQPMIVKMGTLTVVLTGLQVVSVQIAFSRRTARNPATIVEHKFAKMNIPFALL